MNSQARGKMETQTVKQKVNIYLQSDVDYYNLKGNSATNVFNSQRSILFGVQLITSLIEPGGCGNKKFDIDFKIAGQAVWISGGPSSTDSAVLLGQSFNMFPWSWAYGGSVNDLGHVHMITGKDLDGSTIGRAWKIGGFDDPCGSSYSSSGACKQSIAQPNFSGSSWYMKIILMSHELGHVMNALHSKYDSTYSCGSSSGASIRISGSQVPFFSASNADRIASKVFWECLLDTC